MTSFGQQPGQLVRHAQHRIMAGVEFEPLGREPLGGLSLRSLPLI
jgi:hypothetical protein